MLPVSYLSPEQAQAILIALHSGYETSSDTGTAADLGLDGWNTIPSLKGLPADLVNRVLTSDMSGSSSVISTTGLATASITLLDGIRSRIAAAMTELYDKQGTPSANPFAGLTSGTTAYNHVRDTLVHLIFRFDSRYLLRKRSNIGTGAENSNYELPSGYQITNHPLVLARLKPHGFTDGSVDDTGTSGAYQITTTAPHGYYSGQTITPTSSGSTYAQEILGLDNITQNSPSTGLIADVTSKFVLDAGSVNHFINGQAVVTDGSTNWAIFDWQPKRYVKRLSDIDFELYRDVALTDKIIPGWGSITGIHTGTRNSTDTVAVSTNGTHLMFEGVPQIFDADATSDTTLGIFERKSNLSVDPLTGVWSTNDNNFGFSIVDGQLTNFSDMNSAGWQNIHSYDVPLYFKKTGDNTFELYRDSALTTANKFYPGTDVVDTVSSFTSLAGSWSVNFSDTTPLISGQSVSFRNTDTNFSNTLGISTFTPTATTTPNHDYKKVFHSGDRFIAIKQPNGGGTSSEFYSSFNGAQWELNSGSTGFSTTITAIDGAYSASLKRNIVLNQGSANYQFNTNNGGWASGTLPNSFGNKIVAFDYNSSPRFVVFPSYTNGTVYISSTGLTGSWNGQAPTQWGGTNYNIQDVVVGGTSNNELLAVGWGGPSSTLKVSKSTNGGSVWNGHVSVGTASGSTQPYTVSAEYGNGKWVIVYGDKAFYSTNATSWTTVTLPTSKTWRSVQYSTQAGAFFAIADDGSNNTIKSTDGATWTTVTRSHGNIQLTAEGTDAYGNLWTAGIADPTGTPAFVNSIDSTTWANYSSSTWTLTANHQLENGQPIRFQNGNGTTFDIDGYSCLVPRALWAQTTGLSANQFKLYLDEAMTTPWTPWFGSTISAKTLSSIYYRMAFYAKRNTATKFDLYVDSAMTNAYNQSVDVTGFTSGDMYRTGHVLSMSPPTTGFIQPMFYVKTESYNSVTTWVDYACTVPFPFFKVNGVLAAGESGSTISLTEVESGLDLSYVEYSSTGTYRINNIGYNANFTDGKYSLAGSIKPVFYAKKITNKILELYVNEAMTTPVKSGGTSPNAAAISTASSSTAFQITYFDLYRYRLDTINCYNIGGERYFYMDYSGGGNGIQKVNATWTGGGSKFYTDHNTINKMNSVPDVSVAEFDNTNSGSYYGMLRPTKGSGSTGTTGALYIDPSIYGGVGSPVYYNLENPGQFQYDSQFVFGISANAQVGTHVIDPLDRTGDEWVTDSNLIGQYSRYWPSHVQPATLTWGIEQPNQIIESQNSTRYTRAKDITQYRFKLSYSPMTKEQFRPFLNIITAAKGGFKPFRFIPPRSTFKDESVTISISKKNITVPVIVRARTTINGGQQIIKLDGLPPNLTDAFSAGHALELTIRNSLGSWALPIHDVYTNEYGEANIRVNNSITTTMYFGSLVYSNAQAIDCFLDSPTVDIKVDTLGYHYLDVDFITKRIF